MLVLVIVFLLMPFTRHFKHFEPYNDGWLLFAVRVPLYISFGSCIWKLLQFWHFHCLAAINVAVSNVLLLQKNFRIILLNVDLLVELLEVSSTKQENSIHVHDFGIQKLETMNLFDFLSRQCSMIASFGFLVSFSARKQTFEKWPFDSDNNGYPFAESPNMNRIWKMDEKMDLPEHFEIMAFPISSFRCDFVLSVTWFDKYLAFYIDHWRMHVLYSHELQWSKISNYTNSKATNICN